MRAPSDSPALDEPGSRALSAHPEKVKGLRNHRNRLFLRRFMGGPMPHGAALPGWAICDAKHNIYLERNLACIYSRGPAQHCDRRGLEPAARGARHDADKLPGLCAGARYARPVRTLASLHSAASLRGCRCMQAPRVLRVCSLQSTRRSCWWRTRAKQESPRRGPRCLRRTPPPSH